MAKGDFEKSIRPKITNPKCESCGQSSWQTLEEHEGDEPVITFASPDGNYTIPPGRLSCVLTICTNCRYVRVYAIPTRT